MIIVEIPACFSCSVQSLFSSDILISSDITLLIISVSYYLSRLKLITDGESILYSNYVDDLLVIIYYRTTFLVVQSYCYVTGKISLMPSGPCHRAEPHGTSNSQQRSVSCHLLILATPFKALLGFVKISLTLSFPAWASVTFSMTKILSFSLNLLNYINRCSKSSRNIFRLITKPIIKGIFKF